MTNQPVAIFGEVLWDTFPDGKKVLGGAPFNVAWHLQAFGLSPVLVSRVGKDEYGDTILQEMSAWGLSTEGMQIDRRQGTGIVSIDIVDGQPQYDIEKPKAYDFIDGGSLPFLPPQCLLYHGTLATRTVSSAMALEAIKTTFTSTIFFDVNLRAPWWELAKIEACLKTTTWLKLNDEELPLLLPEVTGRDQQIAFLFERYSLEYIVFTEGKAGATLFTADGDRHTIQPQTTNTVVDTVGAGDGFCSILLLGIVRDWPLALTLERAQAFASAIVGIQGATTKDQHFYDTFRNQWV
ncbi:MAG: carbohydrate kinase [Limnothrix sp. RL_2_0]|nr:carbohydrate kinase [Limnothrix sp. RL_2_0]